MIGEALYQPEAAIVYYTSRELTARFPERYILEGFAGCFNPFVFSQDGNCSLALSRSEHAHVGTHWAEDRLAYQAMNASYRVEWQDATFDLIWMHVSDAGPYFWLIGETSERCEAFYAAVAKWNLDVRGEILVFAGGMWTKDEKLYQSIKSTTFESLVLPPPLKVDVSQDLERFLSARELYARYRIPWKRGVLLVGPPGNGKTHAVKAIVNKIERPCVYVKSFDLPMNQFPHAGIAMVFERARSLAPCVLVLEDLDALIGDHNRSFFLNELDGFAGNEGLAVIATTNHPERLDPSIIDRPSRFDRKFHFELPGDEERAEYFALWNRTLEPELRLAEGEIPGLVEKTAAFSYAYIKELFLSSMMAWIAKPEPGSLGKIMADHVDPLRAQMSSIDGDTVPSAMPFAGLPFPPHMLSAMMAGRASGVMMRRVRSSP